MQQFHQEQLRHQVAYMQQAMMAGYPSAAAFPMPSYPGATPYMGATPQALQAAGKGKGKFGGKGGLKGGKGGGKQGGLKGGRTKGKGVDDGDADDDAADVDRVDEQDFNTKERKEEPPIVKAQRDARERAEAIILKKLQGRWADAADSDITYVVEGNTVSVSNSKGGRVFHNRLSMYGTEFCWNAKRFWHDLNLQALNSSEQELPCRVEWNPGKSSPPAEQIIWKALPPEPEAETVDATDDGQQDNAEGERLVCGVVDTTDPSNTEGA